MGGVYLRDETKRGNVREVTVIGQNNGEDESESWLIFERPVAVPDRDGNCPGQVPIEIAFRLQWNEKEQREEVARTKDSPLVVFFPTEKETRFGFLIQGPYRTTPARDNIPKEDDWNATLVNETSCLMADVLPQLKDLGLLSVSLLEALPIRADDFPEDGMFYPIFDAVRNALLTQDLLPADDGSFVSARNAKLARGADLRKLLDHEQLRKLFQSDATVEWLAGNITQDRTPELRTYLLNELEVEEITPDSFARRITQSFLSIQVDEWLAEFYGYLSGQEALWRAPRWSGDSGGVLRSRPILRLEDDSHVIPFRADGTTPNAFLPPPEDTDFPIVKRSIASDEQAGNFLKRLGLSEPNVFDDIVERVLPKYSKSDLSTISETEHAADILKLLRALTSDSEAGKKRVIQKAMQTPFLKAVDPVGNLTYKKPLDIYQDNPTLRQYFSGTTDAWFLSEQPLASASSDILIDLGIATLPRRILFSDDLPSGVREYSTRAETIENYYLHGLDDFLESFESLQSFEDKAKVALVLWGYLKEHLELDSSFFRGRYHWFYYSGHSKSFDSQMLTRLRNTKWIPTRDGSIEKPGDINTDQLLDDFQGAEELNDALGINQGVGHRASSEDDKKREHANMLGVSLEDIEFLKMHPDEFAQLKAEIASRNTRPIFPTRTVTNPERRQERVTDLLSESSNKEYEAVSYTHLDVYKRQGRSATLGPARA